VWRSVFRSLESLRLEKTSKIIKFSLIGSVLQEEFFKG